MLHSDYICHLTGYGHPETPGRYAIVVKALETAGLLHANNTLIPQAATYEHLLLCHTADYIKLVQKDTEMARQLQQLKGEYTLSSGDVQICPDSYRIALLACGAGIAAVDAIMKGNASIAFCCVRPPGHHATAERGMGFCLFNNVAIAARYAQRKYGLERVLIADWDVHHGNGTQDIFYEDPSVFYFSTHQQGIYPGTGSIEEVGKGNILNCPIAAGENSRLEVLEAFQVRLAEAAARFKPQLVIISAGFDAHCEDSLGRFNLTEEDFAHLTGIVKEIANTYSSGRIVSMLEGGYNLHALAASVVAHVRVLISNS